MTALPNLIQTGPPDAPVVLLIHPVGYDLSYLDRQIEALLPSYRVVAYDLPGHGRSPGTPADCTFEHQVEVVAKVIDAVGGGPVHLVGISYGSMIALHAALALPSRLRSLTLIGSACVFPPPVQDGMRARAALIRSQGMEAVVASSLDRWFTAEMRDRRPDVIDRVTKTILADDPAVQAAIWEDIAGMDLHARLHEIVCPALIVVGDSDPSTPPAAAAVLAENIGNAKMVVLPGVSHMVMLEAPDALNGLLLKFYGGSDRRHNEGRSARQAFAGESSRRSAGRRDRC